MLDMNAGPQPETAGQEGEVANSVVHPGRVGSSGSRRSKSKMAVTDDTERGSFILVFI